MKLKLVFVIAMLGIALSLIAYTQSISGIDLNTVNSSVKINQSQVNVSSYLYNGSLIGGAKTFSDLTITAKSSFLCQNYGGNVANIGTLYISNVVISTSFTVSSSNISDASNVKCVRFDS